MPTDRTQGVKAGAAYFAVVFAAGFVLGTVRVLLLIPRLGALTSVLLELPLMLAISWMACGWALRRFRVPPRIPPRLTMGATAFALLMLAVGVAAGRVSRRGGADPLADVTFEEGGGI